MACVHTHYLEAQIKVFITIGKNSSHFHHYFYFRKNICRTACKHAADKLQKQSYKGYAQKQEAHSAYDLFKYNGTLPVGIPAPDPNDGGPSQPPQGPGASAFSPQRRSGTPQRGTLQHGTPQYVTPTPSPQRETHSPRQFNTGRQPPHGSPLPRFNLGQQPLNITINTTTTRIPPPSQINRQLASTSGLGDDYKFWVVITGAHPGVYEGR